MTLVINDPELDRLAQELADATGVSVEEAVRSAVEAKLADCGSRKPAKMREIDWEKIRKIQDRVAAMPVLDSRPIDEMLYDEYGLPK